MENVLVKLKHIHQNYKGTDSFIARTIIENLDNLHTMNIRDIAKISYTSPTTITRFSQKLNYEGWVELKLDIKNNMYTYNTLKNNTIEQNSVELVNKTIDAMIDSLNDSKNIASNNNYDDVISDIKNAENIYVIAQGGTYLVAEDFAIRLQRLRMKVWHSNDFIHQKTQVLNATPNDVFILISYSGETENLIDIAKRLKTKNIKTISITRHAKNTLRDLTTRNIAVANDNNFLRSMVSSGRINIFCTLEILYYLIFNSDEKRNIDFIYQSMKWK